MNNNLQNQMMNNLMQNFQIMNAFNNMRQISEMINNINKPNMQMNNPAVQEMSSSNDQLLVTFQTKDENNNYNPITITVQCLAGDKVSKLIENYRFKSGDRDESKKFIYNAKSLVPSLTCAESGLTNNCIVFVISTKHVKGA